MLSGCSLNTGAHTGRNSKARSVPETNHLGEGVLTDTARDLSSHGTQKMELPHMLEYTLDFT